MPATKYRAKKIISKSEFIELMEVYFTSPTLGQIQGTVTTADQEKYQFNGRNVLISIELYRSKNGWIGKKDQWLLPSQIDEIGLQIDKMEKWLSAQ